MTDTKFFGRKFYLDILEKHIKDFKEGYRQNLAFVGDELAGKTSIILNFLNRFSDPSITIVYLEVRPQAADSFIRKFIGTLLYNFLVNSGIRLEEDLDFLIEKSAKYIPKTVEKIKSILKATEKNKGNIFAELLMLCEIMHQETNKFCVIIFDEFQNLETAGFKKLYQEWAKILISQKNTMYIIVSSMRHKTKNILSRNLSLLFGNFAVVEVEPFDIKISEEYLLQKLQDLNLCPSLRDFIVHFTGGCPFYLEIISDALLKLPQSTLTDMLESLLLLPSGILNQKFSNVARRLLDGPFGQEYIAILYQVSCGHNKIKDIAHLLHKTRKELDKKIDCLLESDVIKRNGDFLKINDRVFGFWLRFVYQEKLQSLTFNADKQKVLFRGSIENMIQEFILNEKKPITERMSELLCLFGNETVQIERKKVRLSHFKEIKPLEFSHEGLRDGLLGRSSESLWLMAFKNDSLTEDDISQFARECKKYRHKSQRKIIVTFKDIDANARLKALDEKIWAWDLNNLNQILDLFYKPRVIA